MVRLPAVRNQAYRHRILYQLNNDVRGMIGFAFMGVEGLEQRTGGHQCLGWRCAFQSCLSVCQSKGVIPR